MSGIFWLTMIWKPIALWPLYQEQDRQGLSLLSEVGSVAISKDANSAPGDGQLRHPHHGDSPGLGSEPQRPNLPDTTNGSWLNRIESQFTALKKFAMTPSDYRDHEEQQAAIESYLTWRNHARELSITAWNEYCEEATALAA